MAVVQGVVRVCQDDQKATFQVCNRATMAQSPAFRRRAEQLLAEGVRLLRIDLSLCTHVDSTFVGTLLTLKREIDQKQGQMMLIAPLPTCRKALEQMGVHQILPIVAGEGAREGPWEELASAPDDVQTLKRDVTEAHEELARLPGEAGEAFRGVMRCLAREAESRKNP
jgi:anti-anti-sigma regulatory factor